MKRFSIFLFSLLFLLVPISTVELQFIPSIQSGNLQFNYRGNWSSTASYSANDAVRGSDGKLYVATEDDVPVNTNPVGAKPILG